VNLNEVGEVRSLEVLKTSFHSRKICASGVFEEWPDLGFVSSKAGMNVRLFPHGTIGSGLSHLLADHRAECM